MDNKTHEMELRTDFEYLLWFSLKFQMKKILKKIISLHFDMIQGHHSANIKRQVLVIS